ncbi:MAG: hypothetical protein ACOCOC_06950 [Prevotella sp.]
MKGIKTKIVVAPFKAWFTFGGQIADEGGFTLSSDSLVAFTALDEAERKAMYVSYLKRGSYPGGNSFWGDPCPGVYKGTFIVKVSYEAVDGAVAYVSSDDLKLWRKATE